MKIILTVLIAAIIFSSCSTNSHKKKKYIPMNSLEDVITNLKPIKESYEINPNEETLLTSEKGTVTYIPADAFEFADGTIPTGNITIEIKECYSLSDMIAENMSTTSGHRILQTAGMVYFNATTDGKQLSIKKGKAYVVGFPKNNQTEEMDLFYDFPINDSLSTWIPDYNLYEAKAWRKSELDTTPSEGDEAIELEYPIEMTDDLYDYCFSTASMTGTFYDLLIKGQNRTILDYIRDPTTIEDSIAKKFYEGNWRVHYDLNIDENGKMTNLRVEDSEYTSYNDFALRVVKEYFESAPAFDLTMDSVKVKHDWDYGLGVMGSRRLNTQRFKKRFREQYSDYTNRAIQQIDNKALDFYLFSATEMGWINCDKFWDLEEDMKVDFTIRVNEPENTKIQIVFKDINSIMTGNYIDGNIIFPNVPLNREIKIIGISYSNNKPTLGVAKTIIDKDGFELNSFSEFTLDQLEKELNTIE